MAIAALAVLIALGAGLFVRNRRNRRDGMDGDVDAGRAAAARHKQEAVWVEETSPSL